MRVHILFCLQDTLTVFKKPTMTTKLENMQFVLLCPLLCILTLLIFNALAVNMRAMIIDKMFHPSLSSCFFAEGEFKPALASTLGECAVLCAKSTDCGAFIRRHEECGLLQICPRCCMESNGSMGWNVYCSGGKIC